jgi:hypothetical protein
MRKDRKSYPNKEEAATFMSLQQQEPEKKQDEVQPFGITLIAAMTALIPLVILLRGEARSLSILAALVGVIAGVGLFFQKAWGRWLTVGYYGLSVVLLLMQSKGSPLVLPLLILPVTILCYLFLPGVAACFASKKQT